MGLALSIYNSLRPGIRPKADANQYDGLPKPDGPLIWIHVSDAHDNAIVDDLMAELSELNPDVWFVVTTNHKIEPKLLDQCVWQTLPPDSPKSIQGFLDHWKPSVLAWLSGELRPAILSEAHKLGMSLYLIDTGGAIETSQQLRFWPGLRRSTLQLFDGIVVGDDATADALRQAGAPWEHIEITGVLEKDIPAPTCSEAERDSLAELLNSRPVWLAAEIHAGELEAVLAAHRQASRRAHRLLLIIVPDQLDLSDTFARTILDQDFILTRRSDGGEPEPDCQVYLADTEDELGLWYRLAPMSFIGQTISNRSGAGPNPFEAAALGSVVLHGPGIAPYALEYMRLERAGATEQVSHAGDLALAIEALLSPDKAAEMAHAAWLTSTAGAEVLDRVTTLLDEALTRQLAKS